MVQLSQLYVTTGKTSGLDYTWTFDGKVMSLLFNMLSRFVIAFLPRSKHLLISWLQSPSAGVLEPKKKSVTTSTFSPSICYEVMGTYAMILYLLIFNLSQIFDSSPSPSSRGSLVPPHFLPLEWYHPHICSCWCFSHLSWFQLVTHPARHFSW